MEGVIAVGYDASAVAVTLRLFRAHGCPPAPPTISKLNRQLFLTACIYIDVNSIVRSAIGTFFTFVSLIFKCAIYEWIDQNTPLLLLSPLLVVLILLLSCVRWVRMLVVNDGTMTFGPSEWFWYLCAISSHQIISRIKFLKNDKQLASLQLAFFYSACWKIGPLVNTKIRMLSFLVT